MALTQVSTGGIKDGQVHTADIASANITFDKFEATALDYRYTLGVSGSDHFTFQGEGLTGTVNDPTLYLTRGKTYRFALSYGSGSHPFRIQSTTGTSGTEYNTGVTNNAGAGGSTVIFEVPYDAPDVLYYQCTSHAAMNGIFYVTGALADGTVTTAKLADSNVTTAKIADDAVTDAKIANSINTAIAANTAKTTNATHTGEVTGSTALTIADNVVDEANLKISNSPTNGYFLSAQSGNTGGLTWAEASGTTINSNADNRVITGSGTANTLNGESLVVVDSNNNLGVGTASPNVLGTDASSTILSVIETVGNRRGKIEIGDNQNADGGGIGDIHFVGHYQDANHKEMATIGSAATGSTSGQRGGILQFKTKADGSTACTERMRIDSSGKVMINSSTQTANGQADNLVIYDASAAGITIATATTNQDCSIYFADADDNDNGKIVYMTHNRQFRFYVGGLGTPVMQWNPDYTIYFNGNMYSNGNAYSTGSDLRMKSNLVRFTGTLDKLKQIVGYQFDIKCGDGNTTRKSAGVIAQDVEKVYPELVDENPETGMKSIEYSNLIGVLVEAVKELTTKVETLETKVAALEAA